MNHTADFSSNEVTDNKKTFLTALAAGLLVVSCMASQAHSETTSRSLLRPEGESKVSVFPKPHEVEQDGLKPHVGVTAGVSNPEGSYKSGAEYGVNFGFQPYVPFGLGMSLTFSKNQSKESDTRDLDRTSVLVRGSYNFGGNVLLVKNSYVGLATGPIINQDATYFGIAPLVGFDIPVREWSGKYLSYLSVGAEAKYMIVSSNESDGLTVNGVLKYWF